MTKIDKDDIHDLRTLLRGISTRATFYKEFHEDKSYDNLFLKYADEIVDYANIIRKFIEDHI